MAKKRTRRTLTLDTRKDVLVKPPAARIRPGAPTPLTGFDGPPPWEDLYKDADRERRTLEAEKKELVDFGSQMCSLALSLTKMLVDAQHPAVGDDGETVTIPKFLHESQLGAGLQVGTDKKGNPFLRIKERGKARLVPVQ